MYETSSKPDDRDIELEAITLDVRATEAITRYSSLACMYSDDNIPDTLTLDYKTPDRTKGNIIFSTVKACKSRHSLLIDGEIAIIDQQKYLDGMTSTTEYHLRRRGNGPLALSKLEPVLDHPHQFTLTPATIDETRLLARKLEYVRPEKKPISSRLARHLGKIAYPFGFYPKLRSR